LYVLRLDPPALLELDADQHTAREVPLVVPPNCSLDHVFPASRGSMLVLELGCSFGQAVLWLNAATGEVSQPVKDSDSHFLAWDATSTSVYVKVDSINRPHFLRLYVDGRQAAIPISEFTYDVALQPNGPGLLFSLSRGLGLGSEMWFSHQGGQAARRLAEDQNAYISLSRWSPDGHRVAFIKIPDSQTPFPVGELWVMESDGSNPVRLAQADAGHGFAPAWSPDGRQIVFVARDNAGDPRAEQSAAALISNLHSISPDGGEERSLTNFQSARVEAAAWEPDGKAIAFTVIADDRMNVYVEDLISSGLERVPMDAVCCPVWLSK
jgi:dipeptidyl aminopeptidase/acylaminoacyl peptidase